VFMYLCMNVRVYVCTYVCIYIYVYLHIYIYIHMYVYIYIYIFISTHICVFMYVYTYICMYIQESRVTSRKKRRYESPPIQTANPSSRSRHNILNSSYALQTHGNTRQHTITYCNTLQHTAHILFTISS